MSAEVAWADSRKLPERRRGKSNAVLRRVTAVLELNTLGNQALATLLAAAAENGAAGFAGHAGTEAELVFPRAFGRLIGAFAHGVGLGEKGS